MKTLGDLLDEAAERNAARLEYLCADLDRPDVSLRNSRTMKSSGKVWSPTQAKAQLARALTVQRRKRAQGRES